MRASHSLHQRIATTLERLIHERRVVVFYDLREEFRPFLEELEMVDKGLGTLPRVYINGTLIHLACFEGPSMPI